MDKLSSLIFSDIAGIGTKPLIAAFIYNPEPPTNIGTFLFFLISTNFSFKSNSQLETEKVFKELTYPYK